MKDIICKTVKLSHLKKLQFIQNVNNRMFLPGGINNSPLPGEGGDDRNLGEF